MENINEHGIFEGYDEKTQGIAVVRLKDEEGDKEIIFVVL